MVHLLHRLYGVDAPVKGYQPSKKFSTVTPILAFEKRSLLLPAEATTTTTDITATCCQSVTHFTEQFLTSSSLTLFKSSLKTRLFHTAYCSEQ